MKAIGIVRRSDGPRRVVIPKEIRIAMRIRARALPNNKVTVQQVLSCDTEHLKPA